MPLIDEKAREIPEDNAQIAEALCCDQQLITRLERHMQNEGKQKEAEKSGSPLLSLQMFALAGLITLIACVPIVMFAGRESAGVLILATFVGSISMLVSGKSTLKYISKIQNQEGKTENKNSLFYGVTGKSVMFFFVIIPTLSSIITTLETAWRLGSVQSVASFTVPIGIFLAWQELRGKAKSLHLLRRLALACAGIFLMLSLISAFCTAPQSWDAAWAAAPLVGTLAFVGWLAKRLSAKKCELGSAGKLGLLAYALACLIPSGDKLYRDLKVMSLCSDSTALRQFGFSQTTADELILAIDNFDPFNNKLLFHFNLKPGMYQEAYYKLTGNTYVRTANVPSFEKDRFYGAPMVGPQKVENVKVAKSNLTAKLDSKALCATLDWTFDFTNDQSAPGQEARMLIKIPKNSAITELQLYMQEGKALHKSTAVFGGTLPLLKQYSELAMQLRDPVIVHHIDDEHVMLQCAPLLPAHPARVRMNIVAPLTPARNGILASLNIPYVSASNLAGLGANHLQVSSDRAVATREGKMLKSGESYDIDLQKEDTVQMPLRGTATHAEFSVLDQNGKPRNVQRSFKLVDAPVGKYVLAVDGSYSNAQIKNQVAELIAHDSKNKICKVFLADALDGTIDLPIMDAANLVKTIPFHGGDSNSELLKKSIEYARMNQASVIWVHSAKPWNVDKSWFSEIGYSYQSKLVTRSDSSTKIYSYQTTEGNNQIIEAAHASGRDIGRFVQIDNHGNLRKDLASILTENAELAFTFADTHSCGASTISGNSQLIALADAQVVDQFIRQGRITEAKTYAIAHHQVSAYTAAFCKDPLSTQVDGTHTRSANASNGTVGPQGTDADVIMGSSVPATVRVNNLANLEALLNIVANGMELIGIAWGLPTMIVGLVKFRSKAGPGRAVYGAAIVTAGLATPGCINWLFASSRDLNVFS